MNHEIQTVCTFDQERLNFGIFCFYEAKLYSDICHRRYILIFQYHVGLPIALLCYIYSMESNILVYKPTNELFCNI